MLQKLQKIFRPLVIFYFLVVYIFASFIWWSFLLSRKNIESFSQDVEILRLQYKLEGKSSEAIYSSPEYLKLEESKKRQRSMILGEGLVFFILLTTGAFQIHRSFRREIELNRQQRNFILSITHELKSPLAGIKISLETIINRQLDKVKSMKLLKNARKDTERLRTLVDNILMAANIENEAVRFTEENIDITALIKELVEHYRLKYEDRGSLNFEYQDRKIIKADPMAFNSILVNLIENAIKYSESDFQIDISIKENRGQLILDVADNGIGIPDNEKKKVFRKFYRLGSEETRKTKGTGLGLYLIRELVHLYKGKITILDNSPKGSIFRISWPVQGLTPSVESLELKPA